MTKLYIILLLLFCSFAKAQNAQLIINGLKKDLQADPDAKRTAAIYSDLTWYYSTVSIDSALAYGNKAIKESVKLGDSVLLAQVYSDIGATYFRKGDFESSEDNYLKAYSIRKRRNDAKGLAKINNNLANIYLKKQNYKPAMKAFLEALDYFESIGDDKNTNVTKGNIGLLLFKLKDLPKAVNYISAVISYQEKNNSSEGLCTSCLNMGNVYLQMQDTTNALKFYNKSLKACTAIGDKKGMASGFNNIGNIKTQQRKGKDALALYAKAEQARQELNADLDQARLGLNLANEYMMAKKFAASKTVLLGIKKVFDAKEAKEELVVTYKLLMENYAHLGKPDSVSFFANKYSDLKERLSESAAMKQTAELETKYQTAKKEKQLLENEIEARHKNNLILGISGLAFFIVVFAFLIYRQQKLKNRQQEQEFALKSAISQIETQNRLQEQRLSISRDLHDNIGAQLTFIISSVDNIKYGFDIQNNKLNDKLKSISEFTKSTIVELRDTIWAMNNNAISFEDLKVRILNFIEKAKMATEDIHFDFNIQENLGNIQLTSISGMNIYRTIQEAVNNAIKYADATNIAINAVGDGDKIVIRVSDDGKGFDSEIIESGNGLHNMKKRIEDIGGDFEITSEPGNGTKIQITLGRDL